MGLKTEEDRFILVKDQNDAQRRGHQDYDKNLVDSIEMSYDEEMKYDNEEEHYDPESNPFQRKKSILENFTLANERQCVACQKGFDDFVTDVITLSCNPKHLMHRDCSYLWFTDRQRENCPSCQKQAIPIDPIEDQKLQQFALTVKSKMRDMFHKIKK